MYKAQQRSPGWRQTDRSHQPDGVRSCGFDGHSGKVYGLRRRPRTGRTLNEAHISRVGLRHRKIQERKESQKFKGRGR